MGARRTSWPWCARTAGVQCLSSWFSSNSRADLACLRDARAFAESGTRGMASSMSSEAAADAEAGGPGAQPPRRRRRPWQTPELGERGARPPRHRQRPRRAYWRRAVADAGAGGPGGRLLGVADGRGRRQSQGTRGVASSPAATASTASMLQWRRGAAARPATSLGLGPTRLWRSRRFPTPAAPVMVGAQVVKTQNSPEKKRRR